MLSLALTFNVSHDFSKYNENYTDKNRIDRVNCSDRPAVTLRHVEYVYKISYM